MKNDFVRWTLTSPISWLVFILPSLMVVFALGNSAYANIQSTPTNLPETNAPSTLTPTPRVFCKVVYLVSIRQGVAVNVRPTPSRNTTPTTTINGTQNPYSAVWTDGNWFELCSINRQYITGDPQYVTFVTVTPLPPTPTRIPVTSTPVATSTPTNLAKRICIQYEDAQGTQDVCGLFPVNARVVSIEIAKVEP